jgi:hypothetical protein
VGVEMWSFPLWGERERRSPTFGEVVLRKGGARNWLVGVFESFVSRVGRIGRVFLAAAALIL